MCWQPTSRTDEALPSNTTNDLGTRSQPRPLPQRGPLQASGMTDTLTANNELTTWRVQTRQLRPRHLAHHQQPPTRWGLGQRLPALFVAVGEPFPHSLLLQLGSFCAEQALRARRPLRHRPRRLGHPRRLPPPFPHLRRDPLRPNPPRQSPRRAQGPQGRAHAAKQGCRRPNPRPRTIPSRQGVLHRYTRNKWLRSMRLQRTAGIQLTSLVLRHWVNTWRECANTPSVYDPPADV